MRAVPFNATSLEVNGNPVPLVEGVMVKGSGAADFSISDNGGLVYALGRRWDRLRNLRYGFEKGPIMGDHGRIRSPADVR